MARCWEWLRSMRNWIALFVLGTINNLSYVVVNSAGQDITLMYNANQWIGAITWANNISGVFVRGINAWVLERVSHRIRIFGNALLFAGGIVGVALAPSFAVSLCAIVAVGSGSSFGESVILGYLQNYQPELVGGWSSGTGMAGFAGSLLYLGLVASGLTFQARFLVLLPTCAIYCLTFMFGLTKPERLNTAADRAAASATSTAEATGAKPLAESTTDDELAAAGAKSDGAAEPFRNVVSPSSSPPPTSAPAAAAAAGDSTETSPLLSGSDVDAERGARTAASGGVGGAARRCDWVRFREGLRRNWRALKLVWWIALQLALVYFFEYFVSVGCANKAEHDPEHSPDWFVRNAYAILAFCYQFGVLISRSSLRCLKIRRVEVMTVLQGLNMVLWIFQALYKFMNVWVQFVLMVYVGLLGGGMYVNVFYVVLHDTKIPDTERELCINIVAIFITLGIIFASAFVVLADHTFLAYA